MKKIITLILLFISIISFGQNKEYRKAVNLFNDKKYTEANIIIEKLLNKEYGELEVSQEFYCLQMNLNSYSILNDFKTAYDKSIVYFEYIKNSKTLFVDDNAKRKTIAETEKFITDLKSKIPKDTKTLQETIIASESSSTVKIDNLETKVAETTQPISDDKTVTLTVSGTGKTLEEAKLNALRSAIEQAFGAFISSKTEILNDKLVKDEIVSVASGNVQKFDIVSQIEVPNVGYAMTLKTTVSIDKLTSFAESKGVVVEFKGGVFGLNMKLQKLNEKNELMSATEILGIVHETLQNSFDFKIAVADSPQFVKENLYNLEINVSVFSNENYEKIISYLTNSLKAISMNSYEIDNYEKINKKIYVITINSENNKYAGKYYLRNEYSFQTITNIFKSWEFYLGNYIVSNNVNTIEGPDRNTKLSRRMSMYVNDTSIWSVPFAKLSNETDYYKSDVKYENGSKVYSSNCNWNFWEKQECSDKTKYVGNEIIHYEGGPTNYEACFQIPGDKEKIVNFSWNQPYTLSEIEKLSNFEVKSKGVVSQFSNGGYLLCEINNVKIIAAPYEINSIDGQPIKNNIGNLLDVLNNPTSESFGTIIENTAILSKAGENTTGNVMNSFNKSQSTNWSIPSAKELLLMYIKLNKIGVLKLYEYKYYLSSTLPKKDKGYYTYVISDTSAEELHSDFISKIKIPLNDFINNNFEKYLHKCLNTSDITIKPLKYIKH